MNAPVGALPVRLPVLTYKHVRLRGFQESDVDLIVSVASDPLIPLITTVLATGSRDDALAYIARQHERLTSGVGCSFAVADSATDEAVGQIGLWTRDLGHGRASVGFWIAPAHRRRGYVIAALCAVSRWALTLDGIERLELHAEPWNEGSWKAAERVGYLREGLLRGWLAVGGQRRDVYVYGLLKGDSFGRGA
jgi:[ribosomal protein S5]-alanine N-acetyltransferase